MHSNKKRKTSGAQDKSRGVMGNSTQPTKAEAHRTKTKKKKCTKPDTSGIENCKNSKVLIRQSMQTKVAASGSHKKKKKSILDNVLKRVRNCNRCTCLQATNSTLSPPAESSPEDVNNRN